MRRVVAGLALALVLAAPVAAAKPTSYDIALVGVSGGEATFTVTRSQPGTDGDAVVWVHVECDSPTNPDELPVIWGTNASLVGTAVLPVVGSCEAWATKTPWRVKRSDPSVIF